MQKHFQEVDIVRYPDKEVSSLEVLTTEEKRKVLVDWNATQKEYPRNKTVHQLFEDQVKKTPHNIAVVFEDRQLTYRQLNKKANQLAYYLREKGVQPDTLVALACERSLEMIIGILGILKAGGAYVPLDSSYPSERLSYILKDTGASLLLTQAHLESKLSTTEAELFFLDTDQEILSAYPTTNLPCITKPEHLSYVIYTSGSTGKPKGVLNIHKGSVNRLLWMKDYCKLQEDDCVLQKTPYTFDVSVWELLLSLLSGARVLFAKPEGHKDPLYLKEMIKEKNVTLTHFVPSMLEAFLASHDSFECPSLKRVITSGEALSFSLRNRFFEAFPHAELHNLYGPTEASIDVTSWNCSSEDYLGIVPVGKPIWNTSVYILDDFLNPVPVGVIGEMHLGGEGLARGYLNQPKLTAEKFIENPFVSEDKSSQKTHTKLYKTGDLARYLPDGNIEYIGRSDSQVKIRGFRIELGEIENTLLQHPAVKEAVVIAREDSPGDKKLVAYVVLKLGKSKSFELGELRSHLNQILPEYMIPAFFMVLEAFPLTENGKVNRKNLPIPEYQRNEEAYVAPRTDLEKQLCEIWQSILKIERIGIEDNFFELGGDSILNIQIASQARKFGLFLKPRDIFQHPTIAKISPLIEQTRVVPIKHENKGEIPLLPIQQWFFESQFADPHHWNQFFLLKLNASISQDYLEKALRNVFLHHEEFQSAYKHNGSAIKQSYKKIPSPLQIGYVDLKSSSHFNKELEDYISSAQKTLNFEKDPLHKVVIIEVALNKGNSSLSLSIISS